MKNCFQLISAAAATLFTLSSPQLFAQGTAFTYQGKLTTNGAPFTGSAEFQFTLWDAATNGAAVATNNPSNIIAAVNDGLFTVALDFGINPFSGEARFLQADVRTAIGPFTTLTPRQPVTATPYALRALNLTTNGLAGTYANAVKFDNAGNSFVGTFTGTAIGDGSELMNVNAATLDGLSSSNFWALGGNAGANPTNGAFLGTVDNLPLEFRVNGQRVLRFEDNGDGNDLNPDPDGAPNVIAGSAQNFVGPGLVGVTISGGGATNFNNLSAPNTALSHYVTIGGGLENQVGTNSPASTIGGGFDNSLADNVSQSTISGGFENLIGTNATYGTVGGGRQNVIGADADNSTIAGGYVNSIGTNAVNSVIGGGLHNAVLDNAFFGTIPGGNNNTAANSAFAAGTRAKAVHQGTFVWSDSTAADFASTGTNQFLVRASGGVGINTASPVGTLHVHGPIVIQGPSLTPGSTASSNLINLMVGGGSSSVATNGSRNGISFYEASTAKSMSLGYDGSGSSSVNALRIYNSSDSALFTFEASGEMGIGTNAPQQALHVVGNILATGTVTGSSDRNAKENFKSVNSGEVLDKVAALPISRWNYRADETVTHLGPMAQDFYAAFAVGMDDKHISMVDADGVALAAIQGLNEKVENGKRQAETQIEDLKAENADLKARLEKLEQLVNSKKGAEQ